MSFGTKACLNCNIDMTCTIKRDLLRKKFCSRKCHGSYTVKNKISEENRKKAILAMNTKEINAKKGHKGSNHPKWISDRSLVKYRPRYENYSWTKSVFERDNYTCVHCGVRGGKLQADHIKPYSKFPDIRWNINNGRTLCIDCHKKTSTYGIKMRWYNARS